MDTGSELRNLLSRKTPFYLYDMGLLRRTALSLAEACGKYGISARYAMKANNDEPVLKTISSMGFGADCVSGNEVKAAVKAGFVPGSITFAGVGKTDEEIETALDAGIGAFVVESFQEMEVIDSIAASRSLKAPVMLRINPGIDAHTHRYITTGLEENKFGIPMSDALEAARKVISLGNLEFKGIQSHIGSQITDCSVFGIQCRVMSELADSIESAGIPVRSISLGGGLGIDYNDPDSNAVPDFDSWLGTIAGNLPSREGRGIQIEPGRSLVGQCGSLCSRVLYVKEGKGRTFLILDAGMNDFIRPALYSASHRIENWSAADRGDAPVRRYDVVGPVCESSDVFGTDVALPESRRGDLVVIRSAGAYGSVMASRYNLKDLADSLYV